MSSKNKHQCFSTNDANGGVLYDANDAMLYDADDGVLYDANVGQGWGL